MNFRTLMAGLVLAFCTSVACAVDRGGYLSAGGGQVDSATALSLRGGYRFGPNLAAELDFQRTGNSLASGTLLAQCLGSTCGSAVQRSQYRLTAAGISVVGIYPTGRWQLLGRLGVARTTLKEDHLVLFSGNQSLTAPSSDRTGAAYGIGASYEMTPNWNLRLDWDRREFKHQPLPLQAQSSNRAEYDFLTVGVTFSFN